MHQLWYLVEEKTQRGVLANSSEEVIDIANPFATALRNSNSVSYNCGNVDLIILTLQGFYGSIKGGIRKKTQD